MSELEEKVIALGADNEDLADIVYDAASRIASKVNNEGVTSQLNFLKSQFGMSDDEIIKAVKQELDGYTPIQP